MINHLSVIIGTHLTPKHDILDEIMDEMCMYAEKKGIQMINPKNCSIYVDGVKLNSNFLSDNNDFLSSII